MDPKKNQQSSSIPNNVNSSESVIFGISIKGWSKIILITTAIIFTVFILIPYTLATFVPLFNGDTEQLVTLLDGTALIVGVTGTIASVASIIMTLADKKRYNQEKTQMQALISSVGELHREIEKVADEVEKTFQQNVRLGLALYEKKVIDSNPNLIDISINSPNQPGRAWKSSSAAEERPPSQ